ncbi:MAG: hypothetical protein IKM08_02075 [Clostridia bacterium]|nr:hypothetical protein [Clostridia bacterium]
MVVNIINAITYLSGTTYLEFSDEIYRAFPALETLDIACAVVSIVMAVMSLVIRFALKNFKSYGPKLLCAMYLFSAAFNFVYMIAFESIIMEAESAIIYGDTFVSGGYVYQYQLDMNDFSIIPTSIATVIGDIIMAVVNFIYFGHRKQLFDGKPKDLKELEYGARRQMQYGADVPAQSYDPSQSFAYPQDYGQPQGYYGQPQGYAEPQQYYGQPQGYAEPQQYYGQPQGYAEPQQYYGQPQGYAEPRQYYGQPQGYAEPQQYYGQPQGYAQPQQYAAWPQRGAEQWRSTVPQAERAAPDMGNSRQPKRLLGYSADGYGVYLEEGEDLAEKEKQVAFRLDGTAVGQQNVEKENH